MNQRYKRGNNFDFDVLEVPDEVPLDVLGHRLVFFQHFLRPVFAEIALILLVHQQDSIHRLGFGNGNEQRLPGFGLK